MSLQYLDPLEKPFLDILMIVSITYILCVTSMPMGNDDPGTLELSISPIQIGLKLPIINNGASCHQCRISCPQGAYGAGGDRYMPVAQNQML